MVAAAASASPADGSGSPAARDVEPPVAGNVEPIKAITSPSVDLTLSFTKAGKLAKLLVRQGQKVRAGELLAQLEDSVERKQADLLKAKADDTTAIRAAEIKQRRARDVLAKVRQAYDSNAAAVRELEDAQIDSDMCDLDVASARLEHQQDVGKYDQAVLELQRMRLTAPADGEVERVKARAGESVDALQPVLTLVSTTPLWIDTPVPLAIGRHLSEGCRALVTLPDSKAPAVGKVIHVSRVADPASETLEVRIELPNPAARVAGEHVTVTFPPQAGASPTKPSGTPR